MASMSSKMYKNGPKIESDENGKKVLKRGDAKAKAKDKEKNDTGESDGEPLPERHAKERKAMIDQLSGLLERHASEASNGAKQDAQEDTQA